MVDLSIFAAYEATHNWGAPPCSYEDWDIGMSWLVKWGYNGILTENCGTQGLKYLDTPKRISHSQFLSLHSGIPKTLDLLHDVCFPKLVYKPYKKFDRPFDYLLQ